jgi:two-component system sensor histidine kinase UhpB
LLVNRIRNYLHAWIHHWHLSLFEKVIVVNSVMLIGEALVGLWITSHNLEVHHYLIDTGFIVLATLLTFIVNFVLLRASFSPLFHLLSTIREISLGKTQVRAKTYSSDPELSELALAFNTMLDRLEEVRREQTNLILQTQEEAQRRIALELHDEVGQNMTALLIHTEVLKQTMQTLPPSTMNSEAQQQLTEELEQLTRLTQTTTESIRIIAQQLRPSVLDDLGLLSAFRWLVEDSRQRLHLNVALTTRGFRDALTLPTQYETTLFRIAQESLTNIARHAHAEHVTILLAQEGRHIELSIQDDGCGYEQETVSPSLLRKKENQMMPKTLKGFALGIAGMRERAKLLGGTLRIHSQLDHGTVVQATIPCPEMQNMPAISSPKSGLATQGVEKYGNREK